MNTYTWEFFESFFTQYEAVMQKIYFFRVIMLMYSCCWMLGKSFQTCYLTFYSNTYSSAVPCYRLINNLSFFLEIPRRNILFFLVAKCNFNPAWSFPVAANLAFYVSSNFKRLNVFSSFIITAISKNFSSFNIN